MDVSAPGSARIESRLAHLVLHLDPLADRRPRVWVRSPWAAPRPFAAGGYVTFMAEFEPDRVRAACGAEKWRELVRITRRHDPGGVSHHNANIPPDADQAR